MKAQSTVSEPSAAALLEIDDLTLVTGPPASPRRIVSGVSLDVARGERLGIVGESGSGKSMTAAAIMGLLPDGVRIDAGSVRIGGIELLSLSEAGRRTVRGRVVSIVYQNALAALNPVIPVGRQIADVARAHLAVGKAEAQQRAVALMTEMGIPDAARRAADYPHQFSGGMAQRAAIAMALVCEPQLVIADEPTTGLDATIQVQVLSTIDRSIRATGSALMLISHDLSVVASMTDELVVFFAGVTVERGPTAEVMAAPLTPYTRSLITSVTYLRGQAGPADGGRQARHRLGSFGCPYDDDCALPVAECRATPVRLRPVSPDRLVAVHDTSRAP